MPDVIFARPQWDYASYADFYRLIELSGYPLVFFDAIEPDSDNTYIMTILNGENMGGWVNPRARIILWDIEWRLDNPAQIPGVCETWASDRWYAEKIKCRYVPFGSHPDLAPKERTRNGNFDFDVATLAYAGPARRSFAYNAMLERGLKLSPNGWGDKRELILQHSRAMVHVHQLENVNTVAPQRFALAAAYRLPLITETLYDRAIFKHGTLLMSDYAHLAECTQVWTKQSEARMLDDYGWYLHNLLCRDYSFRVNVEAAL